MIILGLNAYHGNASAVIVSDGRLVAAVEEERFRRVKPWAGFPERAIEACLSVAGVEAGAIDHFAVSRIPRAPLLGKAVFTLTTRPSAALVRGRARNSRSVRGIAETLAAALHLSPGHVRKRLHWVGHHPAHLASAFFVSPFEEAAVCAIDGFGNFVSTSVAVGRGAALNVRERVFFPHSLGLLYLAVSQYLGIPRYGDEYKMMGLAPYGEPRYVGELRESAARGGGSSRRVRGRRREEGGAPGAGGPPRPQQRGLLPYMPQERLRESFATAVKLGDGGPVFYRQTRVGRGGARSRAGSFVPCARTRTGRSRPGRRTPTTRASPGSAGSCARRRWTSSRSSGTSSAAT